MPFIRRETKHTFQKIHELDKATGVFCFLAFPPLSSNFSSCFNSQSSVKGNISHILGLSNPVSLIFESIGCWPLLQLRPQWPADTSGCVPTSQPATAHAAEFHLNQISLNQIPVLLSVKWLGNWAAMKWGKEKTYRIIYPFATEPVKGSLQHSTRPGGFWNGILHYMREQMEMLKG